jgi:FMN phosphatase YigB (HAD superfamily)
MTLKAVFFDVGETLIDESRMWRGWAAYLGVPAQEFLAALEDVIASGADHRRVFDRFRANFDIAAARRERTASGDSGMFAAEDLYAYAAPALRCRELRKHRDATPLLLFCGPERVTILDFP